LQDFVHEYLLRTGRRCYVVIQNHQLVGLITPIEIRRVDRDQWPQTSVQSVMRPLKEIRAVWPETPAIRALEIMSRDDINQLPVVAGGHLLGIFSRSSVIGFLQNRTELPKH
jgi:CBS domain-containing protein